MERISFFTIAITQIVVATSVQLFAQADDKSGTILGHAYITLGDGNSHFLRGQEIILLQNSDQYRKDVAKMDSLLRMLNSTIKNSISSATNLLSSSSSSTLMTDLAQVDGQIIYVLHFFSSISTKVS